MTVRHFFTCSVSCSGRILQRLVRNAVSSIHTTTKTPRFIDTFSFVESSGLKDDIIPTFRIMDESGSTSDRQVPDISNDALIKMYKSMVLLNTMDKIFYESQRQGRISFYMTNYGEEATQIAVAAALDPGDLIYGQYRESGALLHRGFSLDEFCDQCYGNVDDYGKGKQMPVHYGSKKLNFVTISSPLATQMPQAVGSAYAYKMANRDRERDLLVLCYFGEGAASEGDAHAAFNFASTLNCPVIFLCRNNGYAISTPVSEQYKGDGIASRAAGYGMAAVRVDGNDTLAMYQATLAARTKCLAENCPVLIEAMTYREGHHSTSDDSSAYRDDEELKLKLKGNPILRLGLYLRGKGLLNDQDDEDLKTSSRKQVMDSFARSEKKKKPPVHEMFNDVYDVLPPNLISQRESLKNHLKKCNENYNAIEQKFIR